MSDDKSGAESVLELPHNAWFDIESGTVTFSLDRISVSFEIDEFLAFSKQIEEITQVFEQMIVREEESCPTCGTSIEYIGIRPPSHDEFN